jgi:two-component system, OmpR family, phosphate regulon sensor histidine kinase PhoR
VIGSRRQFLNPSALFGGRLRLLVATLLLALPLGAGVLAFADFAGGTAEDRADTQLSTLLRSALQEYASTLDLAQSRATATAARRDVQVALARADRVTLSRAARAAGVRFELPGRRSVGRIRAPAGLRSVEVVVGGRRVGRVIAGVTLDHALIGRLAREIQLPAGDRLVLRKGSPTPRARTVRLDGSRYRATSARLIGGKRETSLLVLAPASRIEGSAARARNRVLLAGAVTLGGLALFVYAFAPVIARGRLVRQQRDQAARVLSHLGEGVLLVDDDGVIRLWNQSAEAITGLPADSVQGRPVVEAIPDWPGIEDRIAVGDERAHARALPIEVGGRQLWLSFSGVRFSEGRVYAFRDLTEERRLEQMRSDFVATVSHELRTPLASIHGAVLTLAKRGDELEPALRDRLLAIVRDQSERLSELVEQILLAAQLDSGGLQFVVERFDAEGLARGVIETSLPRIPPGVTVELAGSAAQSVVGDLGKTRRILSNLLDNAVKYSPDGGRIDVIIAPEANRLRFTVRDEGLGIPPGEQDRIFEKFYRLDAAMSRGVGGSGLGLYICRELVEGMNGRIWVSSKPGAGSSFSFELPLADPQAATV